MTAGFYGEWDGLEVENWEDGGEGVRGGREKAARGLEGGLLVGVV